MRYLIGIDIGGTTCSVTLGQEKKANEGLNILDMTSFFTNSLQAPDKVIQACIGAVKDLLSKHQLNKEYVSAIGIACGGPLDRIQGKILSPPNLPGWDDIAIVEIIAASLQIPTYLENDANACALAEWQYGAGRGTKNLVFLTFGTGMGAGLILNGTLYRGSLELAGEVGHIRLSDSGSFGHGKEGSFEGFCSGSGIQKIACNLTSEALNSNVHQQLAQNEDDLKQIDAHLVAIKAREGDTLARSVYDQSAYYLGQGLSILMDILDPDIIVIGSIFERAHDLLWPIAREVILKEALPQIAHHCKVVSAELGDELGQYASLAVASYGGQ